jgi:hypothetical protein
MTHAGKKDDSHSLNFSNTLASEVSVDVNIRLVETQILSSLATCWAWA